MQAARILIVLYCVVCMYDVLGMHSSKYIACIQPFYCFCSCLHVLINNSGPHIDLLVESSGFIRYGIIVLDSTAFYPSYKRNVKELGSQFLRKLCAVKTLDWTTCWTWRCGRGRNYTPTTTPTRRGRPHHISHVSPLPQQQNTEQAAQQVIPVKALGPQPHRFLHLRRHLWHHPRRPLRQSRARLPTEKAEM